MQGRVAEHHGRGREYSYAGGPAGQAPEIAGIAADLTEGLDRLLYLTVLPMDEPGGKLPHLPVQAAYLLLLQAGQEIGQPSELPGFVKPPAGLGHQRLLGHRSPVPAYAACLVGITAGRLPFPPGQGQHRLDKSLEVDNWSRATPLGEVAMGANRGRQIGKPASADEVNNARPKTLRDVKCGTSLQPKIQDLVVIPQEFFGRRVVQQSPPNAKEDVGTRHGVGDRGKLLESAPGE